MAYMDRDLTALPSTIVGWSDWIIDFFSEDVGSYEALFGADVDVVAVVARGVKAGGPPKRGFAVLKAGLQAWLKGRLSAKFSWRLVSFRHGLPRVSAPVIWR